MIKSFNFLRLTLGPARFYRTKSLQLKSGIRKKYIKNCTTKGKPNELFV